MTNPPVLDFTTRQLYRFRLEGDPADAHERQMILAQDINDAIRQVGQQAEFVELVRGTLVHVPKGINYAKLAEPPVPQEQQMTGTWYPGQNKDVKLASVNRNQFDAVQQPADVRGGERSTTDPDVNLICDAAPDEKCTWPSCSCSRQIRYHAIRRRR